MLINHMVTGYFKTKSITLLAVHKIKGEKSIDKMILIECVQKTQGKKQIHRPNLDKTQEYWSTFVRHIKMDKNSQVDMVLVPTSMIKTTE